MQTFIPHAFNLPLAWAVDFAFPVMLKLYQNIDEIVLRPEDRAMLRSLQKDRLLFFSNHPSQGEPISGENDSLMPFQAGVSSLGFWGLDDARKIDPQADITVLPTFIKYVIAGTDASVKSDLHSSIRILEKKLGIDPGNKNLLRRFLTIGRVLLERAERQYKISIPDPADYDARIEKLRHTILDNVARRLGISFNDRQKQAVSKLRHLLSVLGRIEIGLPAPGNPVSQEELAWARNECWQAYDFIVTRRDYLVSYPTPERFYEWLTNFETLVSGSSRLRPRRAHVFFAPPFLISEYYDLYRTNKKTAVWELNLRLRGAMEELLDSALKLSVPIVRANDVEGDSV